MGHSATLIHKTTNLTLFYISNHFLQLDLARELWHYQFLFIFSTQISLSTFTSSGKEYVYLFLTKQAEYPTDSSPHLLTFIMRRFFLYIVVEQFDFECRIEKTLLFPLQGRRRRDILFTRYFVSSTKTGCRVCTLHSAHTITLFLISNKLVWLEKLNWIVG